MAGGVRWNIDSHVESIWLLAPGGAYESVGRFVQGLCPGQTTDWLWVEKDIAESWMGGIKADSGHRLDKPAADVPEHDVIQRGFSLPIFPKGGGSLLNPPCPAWLFLSRDEMVGEVRSTVLGEHSNHVLRAENAGIDVPLALNILDELLEDSGSKLIRHEVKVEWHALSCLAAICIGSGLTIQPFTIQPILDLLGQMLPVDGVLGVVLKLSG